MINTLAIVILLLYGLALALVGVWAGRKVRQAEDFYVAGRRLGPWLLAATVLAANIGAGTTVGVAGFAYEIGVGAAWWTGSAILGTVVLAFTLGPRIWRAARDLGCYTVGDYLEVRFGVDPDSLRYFDEGLGRWVLEDIRYSAWIAPNSRVDGLASVEFEVPAR